jgi:copper chaperone
VNKVELKIEGLSCGHCVSAVDTILNQINGVESVNVSLPDNAEVSFNEAEVSIEQLKTAINDSEIYKAL